MKSKTVTIDKLSEEQIQQVREFLDSMPNKSHKGSEGELYG